MNDDSTYSEIIAAVKSRLSDADNRVASEPQVSRAACWPHEPTFEQKLLANAGATPLVPGISEEFFEEVIAIQTVLEQIEQENEGLESQNSDDPSKRMLRSLNQRALALSIWRKICIPIRCRGELVIRVVPPSDPMGVPIIKIMSAREYIRFCVLASSKAINDLQKIKASRQRWQACTVVLGILVFAFSIDFINKLVFG
jgi:hypothetical protein